MTLEWALTRRDTPLSALWVVWAGASGLVMGALALQLILDGFGIELSFPGQLFVIALPTATLSAGAVALGGRVRHPAGAAGATLVLSVAAGALCAAPTFALALMTNGERLEAGPLTLAAIVGAFYGAPLGVALGTVYAAIVGVGRALAARRSCAELDVALAVAGLGWMGVGVACGMLARRADLADPAAAGWVLALAGCAAAAAGLVRYEARRYWIGRVRRGRVPGWTLEPSAGTEDVARVYPFGATDALVVSHRALPDGPFRTGDERRAWASVASR